MELADIKQHLTISSVFYRPALDRYDYYHYHNDNVVIMII